MARRNVKRDDADIRRVREVQELRRSSAASPIRNRKRYTRKAKHQDRG